MTRLGKIGIFQNIQYLVALGRVSVRAPQWVASKYFAGGAIWFCYAPELDRTWRLIDKNLQYQGEAMLSSGRAI